MGFTRRVRQFLYDLPIRKKLLSSYLFFIALPLLLFSGISYIAVTRYYADQVMFSARQSFEQAFTFISSKINATEKASDILYFNSDVQRALARDRAEFQDNIIQQNIDMRSLDTALSSFRNDDDVYRVVLYVPDWMFYSSQEINYSNLSRLRADTLHQRVFSSREKAVWFPPETVLDETNLSLSVRVIPLYRKVRDLENLDRVIGVMKICILESNLLDIIEKAKITHGGIVYLRNSQGEVVCTRAGDLPLVSSFDRGFGTDETEYDRKSVVSGGTQYSLMSRNVPNTDWTFVSAIPLAEIHYQDARLRLAMAALILLIGSFACCIAALLTRSTTRRLSLLADAMDRVRNNDLTVTVDPRSGDEIGSLATSFNYMSRQISVLLDAQYRAGQELKNAELRALQAQIDPHFLSNTLELINWKAMNSGVPEIAEISRALARFYSLSLNRGRDIVSIGDELVHVETYVRIQNLRFANRIELKIAVGKKIRRLGVLKLLLQPLVENAIVHGILEKGDDRGGRIAITARTVGSNIVIEVRDNGVGMSDAQIASIFRDEQKNSLHGYGVRNINDRLKLSYGESYGLAFRRNPGGGVTAVVRLPAVPLAES